MAVLIIVMSKVGKKDFECQFFADFYFPISLDTFFLVIILEKLHFPHLVTDFQKYFNTQRPS